MAVAGRDISRQPADPLLPVFDFGRQGAKLQPDAVLLVQMRRPQLVELADFGVDPDLFHHGGVAGSDGLDFCIGQRAAVEVFRRSDRRVPVHHLLDEAGLGLQRLPHIGVERAFRDVPEYPHLAVHIALPQDAALALLDVAGPPGRVEMVQRRQALLHVGTGAHFFGGADQDAYSAGVDRIEQQLLFRIAVGVVDEGDLGLRDAPLDQPVSHFVIDIEARRIGGREVAEHKLG